ncbi:MAG: gamma-glutamyl-gamma-aminobutyrate hydrolase family protein [Nitrospirae bacterium]|nr:gamma-glutamyl-gamma-aminobutyrate hydrolase family protein [Nitrospirota bacterium]
MSVLIIKNIKSEGPGTIEGFLKAKGMEYSIIDLSDCKAEIPDTRDYSHLVVMGGPMAVYEMDDHSFLSYEAAIIRAFIKNGKPVLGICLGAQMIAYALGARVYAGAVKEVGWHEARITEEGMKDPAFAALSVNGGPFAEVFQWHGDTFDLPQKAVRTAFSDKYENQSFRYGDNIHALQFHIEVTPEIIREWFADQKGEDIDNMLRHSENVYPEYHKRALKFYEKFFA